MANVAVIFNASAEEANVTASDVVVDDRAMLLDGIGTEGGTRPIYTVSSSNPAKSLRPPAQLPTL